MQTIMGNLDSSLCTDLQIYHSCKSKFHTFWKIAAAKIEEMTVADDWRMQQHQWKQDMWW